MMSVRWWRIDWHRKRCHLFADNAYVGQGTVYSFFQFLIVCELFPSKLSLHTLQFSMPFQQWKEVLEETIEE